MTRIKLTNGESVLYGEEVPHLPDSGFITMKVDKDAGYHRSFSKSKWTRKIVAEPIPTARYSMIKFVDDRGDIKFAVRGADDSYPEEWLIVGDEGGYFHEDMQIFVDANAEEYRVIFAGEGS